MDDHSFSVPFLCFTLPLPSYSPPFSFYPPPSRPLLLPLTLSFFLPSSLSLPPSLSPSKICEGPACEADLLQCGRQMVAGGYALYGSATMIVLSTGKTVNGFTLDPVSTAFLEI